MHIYYISAVILHNNALIKMAISAEMNLISLLFGKTTEDYTQTNICKQELERKSVTTSLMQIMTCVNYTDGSSFKGLHNGELGRAHEKKKCLRYRRILA